MNPLFKHHSLPVIYDTLEGCLTGMKVGGGIIFCSTIQLTIEATAEIGSRLIGNNPNMPMHSDECNWDEFQNHSHCTTLPIFDTSVNFTIYSIGICILSGGLYGLSKGIYKICRSSD